MCAALYSLGVCESLKGKVTRYRMNAYYGEGIAAYVTAVAAVESYINETFFDGMELVKCPLWHLRSDWLERLEIRDKLILITELMFRDPLDPGKQPLQDFQMLARLRNDIVHFKGRKGTPPYISELAARHFSLHSQQTLEMLGGNKGQPWPSLVQCTEGIRWAHNTACRTVRAVIASAPQNEEEHEKRGLNAWGPYKTIQFFLIHAQHMLANFTEITDSDARSYLTSLGINPDAE